MSGWAIGTIHDFPPIRTGQSISSCGTLHLAGYQVTPPHRRTDGAGFIQPRVRAATQGQGRASRAVAAAAAPARVGTLSGWRRSVLCLRDAMRCGARAGIEAIFRAACGRGYSRTWTQRIFGSLRRRLNHDDELSIYMRKRSDFFFLDHVLIKSGC